MSAYDAVDDPHTASEWETLSRICVDLAKSFQVHGVDAAGGLWFSASCGGAACCCSLRWCALPGGMEPGDSASLGASNRALRHRVRLKPPLNVKAYVKTQERRGRCEGDLRGGDQTDDALRRAQDL